MPHAQSSQRSTEHIPLDSLIQDLEVTVKRRDKILSLLNTQPQRVKAEHLAKVREDLEAVLVNLNAYSETGKLNKSELAKSHEAVAHLCKEENNLHMALTDRIIPKDLHADPSLSQFDGTEFTKNLERIFEGYQRQLNSFRQALKLETSPTLAARYRTQFENTLVQIFLNASCKFTLNRMNLNEHANSELEKLKGSSNDSLVSIDTSKLAFYLNSLGDRFDHIHHAIDKVQRKLNEEAQSPIQPRELLPLLTRWSDEIRDQALGLICHLYDVICDAKATESKKDQSQALHQKKLYEETFKIAVCLADAADELIKMNPTDSKLSKLLARLSKISEVNSAQSNKQTIPLSASTAESDEENEPAELATVTTVTRKATYIEKLLQEDPFAALNKQLKNTKAFHPDTILLTANRAITKSERLLDSLQKQSNLLEQSDPSLTEEIAKKQQELKDSLDSLCLSTLQADLYKSYPMPQAQHWKALLDQRQIASVSKPKSLTNKDDLLYEIEIRAKPCSNGDIPAPIYLHLHLDAMPSTVKKMPLLRAVVNNPAKLKVAHIKSSFFRGKGKQWELDQQAQGLYENIVKRSIVQPDFLQKLDRFNSKTQ